MSDITLFVNITSQTLSVIVNDKTEKIYPIATAKNGIGQIENSECTPLGSHRIAEKIGQDAAENTLFVGRVAQDEVYSESLAKQNPNRDWILTRILWLDGLEPGLNCGTSTEIEGASCDTKSRYVYIHGCPDSHAMQIPSSHGCVKMRNSDIIQLFDLVEVDTLVSIEA